jgi:hypothetical protein
MGAAGHAQVRSDAVAVAVPTCMTWLNAHQQASCAAVRSVRIEGVRGSSRVWTVLDAFRTLVRSRLTMSSDGRSRAGWPRCDAERLLCQVACLLPVLRRICARGAAPGCLLVCLRATVRPSACRRGIRCRNALRRSVEYSSPVTVATVSAASEAAGTGTATDTGPGTSATVSATASGTGYSASAPRRPPPRTLDALARAKRQYDDRHA